MKRIIQLLAGYTNGDAISNHARALQKLFRSWGHESLITAPRQHVHHKLRGTMPGMEELDFREGDVVILHLSIGGKVNEVFASLTQCKRAIIYHNITPPEYFRGLNNEICSVLELGLEHVKMLAGVADVNMAVSQFNAGELVKIGYDKVDVVPLVIQLREMDRAPSQTTLKDFDDDLTNILFVGRVAPNKCIDDLICAFYYYQKYHNPNSRLHLIGASSATPFYYQGLLQQVMTLGAENVHFSGFTSDKALRAYYQMSDLFLCMSEHEGVCIPLLEAMHVNMPVLAYAAAAIPETMDGAGVLTHEKHWPSIAAMMDEMIRNQGFRDHVIEGQNKRMARYQDQNLEAKLKQSLAPIL